MSIWYLGYMKTLHFFDPAYSSHKAGYEASQQLQIDGVLQGLLENLGGWVNHLYVFLAAFNIALATQEQVTKVLPSRLKTFLALFLFFTLEAAITGVSFGESFSVYPLQIWMLILALLNVVYSRFGLRGAVIVFVFSLFRFVLPLGSLSDGLQQWMQSHFHRSWEYDSRVEYFLGTAALGLMFGLIQQFQSAKKLVWAGFAIGFAGIIAHRFLGLYPEYEQNHFYSVEHFWIQSAVGTVYIWCWCLFVTAAFLILDPLVPFRRFLVLRWVGFYSLFVFALHKILFVHTLMPGYEWFLAQREQPVSVTFWAVFALMLLCLGISWAIQRLGVLEVIARSGAKKMLRDNGPP